jgi:hypothetical protein
MEKPTPDHALWALVRKTAEALDFERYLQFIDSAFVHADATEKDALGPTTQAYQDAFKAITTSRQLPFTDTDAYRVLKAATEAFVMASTDPGAKSTPQTPDANVRAEMIRDVREAPGRNALRLVELIWSYWHEEGLVVQTMNAIATRFQNVPGSLENDPLRTLEIDPLRPLNNVIGGYIQDEQHRLTVARRAYEYDHHYGLSLHGQAVRALKPADTRSGFIEAFNKLLFLCTRFYKQEDDAGLPLLNALRQVHLLLSQGAHNEFGDLPVTARIEMLMEQWVLARPEFRELLPTPIMVAYPEAWMPRVEAMKTLQGWSDTSVVHFHDLGVAGEQLLLSIRFGTWATTNEAAPAASWARFWRPEIQRYIHAFRAVRGVDLTSKSGEAG